MRRLLVLVGLILALAGTPLRLAEAAEDLERRLDDPVAAHDLEEFDGGVGDDAEIALKAASCDLTVDSVAVEWLHPVTIAVPAPALVACEVHCDDWIPPPPSGSQRQSKLSRFQF